MVSQAQIIDSAPDAGAGTSTGVEVQRSLGDARWIFAPVDLAAQEHMMRTHQLPELIARLLCARGVATEDVTRFLSPSLRHDFPDPARMTDMSTMADFIAQSIGQGKKIAVFGDFDVDGATSTAVMRRFFRSIEIETDFHIPDRMEEGYGPNIGALAKLKERGADIVFILDCGTTSHDVISQGRALGLDLIILDHHESEETLPDANFVINPKRTDDDSGLDMLAAVGVTFLVCVAINGALRQAGYYKTKNIAEPSLKSLLDLVALGTVCDMVPLTGPNRLLVRRGFELMASTDNAGIKALMQISKTTADPAPYHAGFVFGPRINAGSRIHRADLGARLLATDDMEEALNISWTLDDCNKKRKEIQNEMTTRAKNQVMARQLDQNPIIIVDDPDGHPGLAGLVASSLVKQYGKPAAVITYAQMGNGTREGRGSGRSIPGVNIAAGFMDARQDGLLVKGGGHAMAGGFTIDPDKVEPFYNFMIDHIAKQLNGEDPVIERHIDSLISVRGVKVDFIKMLENQVGPFGQGNPEPIFVLPSVKIERPGIVGKNHVRCSLVDMEGGPRLKAVAFGAADTPLGQALLEHSGRPFHIAGQFKVDSWSGQERPEIHILDAAPTGV